jgi:hypothetical protein
MATCADTYESEGRLFESAWAHSRIRVVGRGSRVPHLPKRPPCLSRAAHEGRIVARGDYGPVLILRGDHKGTVGYDDDDEGTAAIVYLGEPFAADYVLIPRADLVAVGATSFQLERWKRAYPWLVKYLGVP